MKNAVSILLLTLPLMTNAQDFAEVPTQWFYNDHDTVTHQNYPQPILSITDTVINGTPCHVVVGDCACGTASINFIYGINRRVYWYNNALNNFSLLYDFNLNAGETWTVHVQNSASDSLTLRVDATGFDTINGNIRKVQYVSTVAVYGMPHAFDGPVVEDIGSFNCLYPQYAACAIPTSGLRCFESPSLGYYDTHLAPVCDEVFADSGIGVTEIPWPVTATVSPNPMHDHAWISIPEGPSDKMFFRLADARGKILAEEKIPGTMARLQRNDLAAGMYFYHVEIDHTLISSGKIIIE